jgi:isopenicillin-N N-acyltransferase-like protein
MEVIELQGTPGEMGAAFGEACREAILGLYEARVLNAIQQAKEYGGKTVTEGHLMAIGQASLPSVAAYHPDGHAELAGIARGSGLDLVRVWVMNALTDLRDVAAYTDVALWAPPVDGEGCSSFLLGPERAADGTGYAGQTWDLATSNMPFVRIVRRRPREGLATTCLTTVGCLSLIGLNAAGIAVGTTNIRTLDARAGVCYLDVIHKALHQPTLAEAVAAVESAPRAGAHYFYLMDAAGEAAALECSAAKSVRIPVAGAYVHCNHVLAQDLLPLEPQGTPVASSHARQGRLARLLAERPTHTAAALEGYLADHEGGVNAICRHDYNGISSNGSVIMNPATRTLRAVHGPACQGEWRSYEV